MHHVRLFPTAHSFYKDECRGRRGSASIKAPNRVDNIDIRRVGVTDINLSTETALIDPVHGAGLERYLLERRLTGSAEFYPWQRRFLNDWLWGRP